jgi:hypothetical protein
MDNRRIVSTVYHDGQKYGPGREDELAEAMSVAQVARLVERGALAGNWLGEDVSRETKQPAGEGEAPVKRSASRASAKGAAKASPANVRRVKTGEVVKDPPADDDEDNGGGDQAAGEGEESAGS